LANCNRSPVHIDGLPTPDPGRTFGFFFVMATRPERDEIEGWLQAADYVQMPPFETFQDAESHAATLAHELTHWTKHDSRLARDMGRVKWGDEGYAKEELVAELGSAFLCADRGITPEVRPDHADYIGSWLTILKMDTRFIFTAPAPAPAQRAADYLYNLQPAQEIEQERAAV
jgi:antirestriction protein ArdC